MSAPAHQVSPALHSRNRLEKPIFKTFVENSPDGILRIDRNMRHLYVNPAIEAAFGLKAAAYLGKTKAELGFPAEMVQAWDAAAQAATRMARFMTISPVNRDARE